jgi:hypothetical protein
MFLRPGWTPGFLCPAAFSPPASVRREGRSYSFYGLIDDIVYDSVFLSLLRVHNKIALYIFLYFIQLLAGVLGQ